MVLTLQSPEILLNHLNNRLLVLRGSVDAYLENNKLTEDLAQILRRLIIAQLLYDRFLIAVAGSQGAGKTTLLQKLYGLDNQWIQGNEGRGEKSPLLILEKEGIDTPEGWIDKLEKTQNGFHVARRQLTVDEFKQALKGGLADQIIPILYVPAKCFGGQERGFILLPGYEAGDQRNNSWQELMRQALIGSAMCMVVSDETRLANSQQKDILRDMYQHYLAGAKPLIVVAKTENHSSEKRDELCQTAREVFEINPEEAHSRVICTGRGEEFESAWRPKLVEMLRDLSSISASVRTRQLDYMGTLLREELVTVLADVEDALREKNFSHTGIEYGNFLKKYDESVRKTRKAYHSAIDRELKAFASAAAEKAVNKYIADEEGFVNGLRNMQRWVVTSSGEREKIPNLIINGAWLGDPPDGFTPRYLDVLEGITREQLGVEPATAVLGKDQRQLLGYFDASNQPLVMKKFGEAEAYNLKVLFSPSREGEAVLLNKEAERSLALLPVLALEFTRIAGLYPASVGVDPQTMTAESNLDESLARIDKEFETFSGIPLDLVKGIAIMLGIDLAVDGDIDTLPALFSALSTLFSGGAPGQGDGAEGATEGAVAAAGVSAAVATVATVIAVGCISVAITREIQRRDAAARDLIRRVINAIRDAHLEHYITNFDRLMDNVRDRLNEQLRERYHLDTQLMQYDRVVKPLADVRSLRSDMLQAINENPCLSLA